MMMKNKTVSAAAVMSICAAAFAGGGNPGPDIIVGDLNGMNYYGQVGGVHAYSIGTTACNIGTERANWIDGSVNHPVIAQNLYRLRDGRLMQIGQGWLKHSFASLQGNLCATCQNDGDFSHLGTGCSDPYDAGLNGSQSGMGPRFQVNASTGSFPWPYANPEGSTGNAIFKRVQVPGEFLTSGNGEIYIAEGLYAALDDSNAGNNFNNASYERAILNANSSFSLTGATNRERAAVFAWMDHGNGVNNPDPSVEIVSVIVPSDGMMHIVGKATDLGDGTWRYDYAIANQNSHRSARAISVPKAAGVSVSDTFFHAPHSHSGETYDNADWVASEGGASVSWSTDAWTLANDGVANAVRWGEMHNYSFVANTGPVDGSVNVSLFRPGAGISDFDVTLPVPSAGMAGCSGADLAEPFGSLDFSDVAAFLTAFATSQPEADLATPFGQWDFSDVAAFLGLFGAGCP